MAASHTSAALVAQAIPLVKIGFVPVAASVSGRPIMLRDVIYGGPGRITGTVKESGSPNSPVHRRVRLLTEKQGHMIRETWSDAVTGAYTFEGVAMGIAYTVLGYDHTGAYNGVIATGVTPESMT